MNKERLTIQQTKNSKTITKSEQKGETYTSKERRYLEKKKEKTLTCKKAPGTKLSQD